MACGGYPFLFPVRRSVVLARTGNFRVLLVLKALLKAFDLGGEGVVRLDQLDAKLVKTELMKRLRALHGTIDVVETVRGIIGTGTWNRKSKNCLPGVNALAPVKALASGRRLRTFCYAADPNLAMYLLLLIGCVTSFEFTLPV